MRNGFVIKNWAACAPGLTSQAQWQAWSAQPTLPAGEAAPALAEMPAMQRRRLGLLGRLAVQAAWWCQGEDLGMPVVFASRYGDAGRALELLAELARGEPVSPATFSLSVHNAVSGMYSIACGDHTQHLAPGLTTRRRQRRRARRHRRDAGAHPRFTAAVGQGRPLVPCTAQACSFRVRG